MTSLRPNPGMILRIGVIIPKNSRTGALCGARWQCLPQILLSPRPTTWPPIACSAAEGGVWGEIEDCPEGVESTDQDSRVGSSTFSLEAYRAGRSIGEGEGGQEADQRRAAGGGPMQNGSANSYPYVLLWVVWELGNRWTFCCIPCGGEDGSGFDQRVLEEGSRVPKEGGDLCVDRLRDRQGLVAWKSELLVVRRTLGIAAGCHHVEARTCQVSEVS